MTNQPTNPQPAPERNIDMPGRPVLFTCLAILVVAVIFAAGFGLGWGAGHLGGPSTAAGQGSRGGDAEEHLYPKFDVFWEAMNILYRNYFGELPDSDAATYGAIRGVVQQLDDPNTSFMTPDEAEFFRTRIEGSFEGIGARVDWDSQFNTLRIVEPFENQPAWNAGIKRDDFVIAVDGDSIVGTDLTSAVEKIRGPKGTKVTLTIARPGLEETFDVEVVRDRIELPTVATDTLDNNIAYIELNSFNENAGDLVREAVQAALDTNASGIILDLRGNPGGLLSQAVDVAKVFLDTGNILIERFSDGREEVYSTDGKAVTTDLPLVVLVNEASASASEIVAGAIQDADRGTVVGATTFGKGSVQIPQTLSDGSIMRVTIARWFTPNDRTIDGEGLAPDLAVEFTDEQRAAGEDPQLDKAIELLGGTPERLPVQ